MFAQASRLIKPYDQARAAKLLSSAILAWDYLRNNSVAEPESEIIYAALQLYLATATGSPSQDMKTAITTLSGLLRTASPSPCRLAYFPMTDPHSSLSVLIGAPKSRRDPLHYVQATQSRFLPHFSLSTSHALRYVHKPEVRPPDTPREWIVPSRYKACVLNLWSFPEEVLGRDRGGTSTT